MNKRAARKKALQGEISIGQLREMIRGARGRGGTSRVNPRFDLEQVLDIYEGALKGRPDDEIPAGTRVDIYTDREVASRDALLITNILRDTAQ